MVSSKAWLAFMAYYAHVYASCAHGTSLEPRASDNAVQVGTFGYIGSKGPTRWAHLDPKNLLCAKGTRQSPIDLVQGSTQNVPRGKVKLSVPDFPQGADFENLGYTVEVFAQEGKLSYEGVQYALKQFHFHLPGEHLRHGVSMAMELHMVWESDKGNIAVVAAFVDMRGASKKYLKRCTDDKYKASCLKHVSFKERRDMQGLNETSHELDARGDNAKDGKFEDRKDGQYDQQKNSQLWNGIGQQNYHKDQQYDNDKNSQHGVHKGGKYEHGKTGQYDYKKDGKYDDNKNGQYDYKKNSHYDYNQHGQHEYQMKGQYEHKKDGKYEHQKQGQYNYHYDGQYDHQKNSQYDYKKDGKLDYQQNGQYEHLNKGLYESQKKSQYGQSQNGLNSYQHNSQHGFQNKAQYGQWDAQKDHHKNQQYNEQYYNQYEQQYDNQYDHQQVAIDSQKGKVSRLLETVLSRVDQIAKPGTRTRTPPLIMSEIVHQLNQGNWQTYEGSLTTPPCREGIRWLISDQMLYIEPNTFHQARRVIGFNSRFPQGKPGEPNVLSPYTP